MNNNLSELIFLYFCSYRKLKNSIEDKDINSDNYKNDLSFHRKNLLMTVMKCNSQFFIAELTSYINDFTQNYRETPSKKQIEKDLTIMLLQD